MAITLTQLVAFSTVVRRGSVTAAAEELMVTQPSVSAAVGALERELGVKLTERAGRSVRPTPAGGAYAAYISDALGLLDDGARSAREAARDTARSLRVSAVTTAGEFLVAPLLGAFAQDRPDLDISLHVGNRADVFQRLARHEVDVALTGRVPSDARLQSRRFADNEYVLVTHPDDPLVDRDVVDAEELGDRAWLMREVGCGVREVGQEFLAAHGLHPRVRTLGSNSAIRQAVRLGLGITLQPRIAVALELDLGMLALVPLRDGLPHRAWYVAYQLAGPARPEVMAFVDFLTTDAARSALAELPASVSPSAAG